MNKVGSKYKLNIISLDIPYPPDYGGIIDIYYKLKILNNLGIKIYFHCFQYGRNKAKNIEEICEEVYYYPRKKNLISFFSQKPYIVKTRDSKKLLDNLLKNDAPILFEGLHSTFLVENIKLKKRIKILRAHNIEHDYYQELSKVEYHIWKRWYYKLESKKLKLYEEKLFNFDLISAISEADFNYFSNKHNNVVYNPIFHGFSYNFIKKLEKYALYHGNLSVAENINSVCFLINNVFSDLKIPFVIAGNNADNKIKKLIERYSNITLIDSPSKNKLDKLIHQARVHILPTFQSTGMKLKLIHVLFTNGAIIINSNMITDSELTQCCIIADTAQDMKNYVIKFCNENIKKEVLELRKKIIEKKFSNKKNGNELIKYIYK